MAYTIKIKKYSDVIEELVAAGAITPGMFLEFTSAGKVVANSAAGTVKPMMVALEDNMQGNGIDDAYASGDPVQVWIPYKGDMVYGILVHGENVAVGAELYVNSAGKLAEITSGTEVAVGHAVEAADASAADVRVIVRIF